MGTPELRGPIKISCGTPNQIAEGIDSILDSNVAEVQQYRLRPASAGVWRQLLLCAVAIMKPTMGAAFLVGGA
jgi:hypothetical protein